MAMDLVGGKLVGKESDVAANRLIGLGAVWILEPDADGKVGWVRRGAVVPHRVGTGVGCGAAG